MKEKIKLPPLKRRKKVLWELCKAITRKRYILPDGTWRCYTCDSVIDEKAKAHTGHCIPDAFGGIRLRYDINNLRVQDFRCNINFGGNAGVFLWRLMKEVGMKPVRRLFKLLALKDKKMTPSEERALVEDLIIKYRIILAEK